MDSKELNKRLQPHVFKVNNGKILRTLNILQDSDRTIGNIQYLMSNISRADLKNSLDYLQDAGYLRISGTEAEATIDCVNNDCSHYRLTVTHRGMELLMGIKNNSAVDI